MVLSLLKKVFGTKNERDLKQLKLVVDQINQLEPGLAALSDEQLKQQTIKLKAAYQEHHNLNLLLPQAYATVREASRRVLGMRHFDVQLMGAIILHQGKIAEMKTGEGKTLTATLALYLNALAGKGAHLVTVNDYLAKRDSEEMGKLFQWLGLTVGVIVHDMSDADRQLAYQCDITYGTNNEFAFDYLRDNMKFDLSEFVQREPFFCIVDEVDSILIDEARTPLIISGASQQDSKLYYHVDKIVRKLQVKEHYTVDEKHHTAVLTDQGVQRVQELISIKNLYDPEHIELVHHLNQSLKAHGLFQKDVHYVVRDQQVVIVDEFTGRLKTGSRWSDGLHQAVEAKEQVEIKRENQTLASITFQNFFRLYPTLSGMTGTADTEAEEFKKIYQLDVVVIPTNLTMIRQDDPDIIFATKQGKIKAIVDLIKDCHQRGQPVLVGTISIENSELLSAHLKQQQIPHEVLNAKQHEREAMIIAQAGRKGAVTIATNMAGRGTDIKLTEETKQCGGLYIIGTERHESRRIDNQLRGRSGRQGDPGHSKFFISLEDDLMRIFGSDRIKSIMMSMGMKEDEPIEHRMISNAIAKAQKKVEAHNFDVRKHLLDFDNVMNEQRQTVYRLRKEIIKDANNQELIEQFLEDVAAQIIHSSVPKPDASAELWPWEELQQLLKDQYHLEVGLNAHDCQQAIANASATAPAEYLTERMKTSLQQRFTSYAPDQVRLAQREILLGTFDSCWKDHLSAMDHLKDGIGLLSYGQKDPLIEYKKEGFKLFQSMRERIKAQTIETLATVRFYTEQEIEELKQRQKEELEKQFREHERQMKLQEAMQLQQQQAKAPPPSSAAAPQRREQVKVGRNDPCPCGSGKKFKQCHGLV